MKELKYKTILLFLSAFLEQSPLQNIAAAFLDKKGSRVEACASFLETVLLLFLLKTVHLEEKKRARMLWEYCQKGLLERVEMLESYLSKLDEQAREKSLQLPHCELVLSLVKRALEEQDLEGVIRALERLFETLGISAEEMEKELQKANSQAKSLASFLKEAPEERAVAAVIQI